MTIIAGMISRGSAEIPDHYCSALVAAISRSPLDSPEVHRGHKWCLAKVDIGVFGEQGGIAIPGGPCLVLAGEPLLSSGDDREPRGRRADAERLLRTLESGELDGLRSATGPYCAALYSPAQHCLTLVTDKLGVRPIYCSVSDTWAVFSSALRVLEIMPFVAKSIDLRGVYDEATFGFPLGRRTAYREIATLGAGELARITATSSTTVQYHRWDGVKAGEPSQESLVAELVPAFQRALKRRLRSDSAAVSFLSGGLDSRAIVATLRNLGVTVHAINFALPGSQDRVFGRMAADALECNYHQLEVSPSAALDAYRKRQLVSWLDSNPQLPSRSERGRIVWSGDGGSVGLGHVYLDPRAVECFERGERDRGIEAFLRFNRVSGAANSALASEFRSRARNWHVEGVRDEVDALGGLISGRALHLFLMLNDQRRHLAQHFENIDLDRIEFHLPFYDSEFLEIILSAPVAPFLRHKLYNEWLKALNPKAASVPWQAYPNHEPCPVPYEGSLRYQWQRDYYGPAEDRRIVRRRARAALGRFLSRDFPAHLIDRKRYGAAVALSLLGLTKVDHVLRVGDTFARYWRLAPGPSNDVPAFVAK